MLPLVEDDPDWHAAEPNRWGTGELEEARVRPELVVEVRYDKVQGNRFRHGTKLIRWRDDKDPQDCTWRELRPPRGRDRRRRRVALRVSSEPELLEARPQRDGAPPHPARRVADLGDPRAHRLRR